MSARAPHAKLVRVACTPSAVFLETLNPQWCNIVVIFGLYWDKGKENGNHYVGFMLCLSCRGPPNIGGPFLGARITRGIKFLGIRGTLISGTPVTRPCVGFLPQYPRFPRICDWKPWSKENLRSVLP